MESPIKKIKRSLESALEWLSNDVIISEVIQCTPDDGWVKNMYFFFNRFERYLLKMSEMQVLVWSSRQQKQQNILEKFTLSIRIQRYDIIFKNNDMMRITTKFFSH